MITLGKRTLGTCLTGLALSVLIIGGSGTASAATCTFSKGTTTCTETTTTQRVESGSPCFVDEDGTLLVGVQQTEYTDTTTTTTTYKGRNTNRPPTSTSSTTTTEAGPTTCSAA